MVKSRSFIATPPGATIKEQLLDRGLSQKEFAVRMGMSEKHISKLINGEVQLTPDVAVRLEMVLGVPAKFWNKLEATYREKLVKAKVENDMDADKELAKKLPYREMSKNGWVPETRDTTEKVIYLRKYFEVVNLGIIKDMQLSKIACRRLAETEKSNLALLAWAQKAKLEARTIETSLVNLETLKKSLPEIRSMTTMNPSDFCPKLIELLSNCGIALGHILLGHINQPNGTTEEDEAAADSFAKETLIPTEEFNAFTDQNDFSKAAICAFAQEKHILCGIVVGRLQKEGFINYNRCNDLKTKYILSA